MATDDKPATAPSADGKAAAAVADGKATASPAWDAAQTRDKDYGRHECLRMRAILVMLGSFLCNGLIFGVINSYSVIYQRLQMQLDAAGVENAATKASSVGALTIGVTFLLSPVAGVLVDRFGIRPITFVGGLLAASGMFLSSLFVHSVMGLCMTYGILFGVGASLAYTPSLVILGHYFSKYMGLVNGFVTAGSSVFTVATPFAIDCLLSTVGLEGCLQCLGGLMSLIMFCALLFKPVKPEPGDGASTSGPSEHPATNRRTFRHLLGRIFNISIWHNKKYVIWALAVPGALFGYFVPYVHMVEFVEVKFQRDEMIFDGKILLICLGITSGLGRIIFGKIADIPRVNRILLQQISFASIGVLTMLLPLVNTFTLLVVIALAMGLFDGCFISLLGPIAFEFCGQSGASQAIGFLLGLCSIPLTVGPVVAGYIYDHQKSYTLPFVLAGVPPIVFSLVLFLVWCVKPERTAMYDVENVVTGGSKASVPNGDCHSDVTQPPSYKEAVTTDEPSETMPLTLTKTHEPEQKEEAEEAETHLNGDIEAAEDTEMSLLSEITKAMVLPPGSNA